MTPEQKKAHALYMREYNQREGPKAKRSAYLKRRREENPRIALRDTWRLIVRRCEDPRHKNYVRYGARGIKLHPRWKDFEVFFQWAQESGWRMGLQIDRKQNDGDYCPENCWWTTSTVNNRNRSNNKLTEADVSTIRQRIKDGEKGLHLAREYGVHHSMIYLIKNNKKWL